MNRPSGDEPLQLVWSSLLRVYQPDAARAWLHVVNPLLGDRRPIDLVTSGQTTEVLRVIQAERADTLA